MNTNFNITKINRVILVGKNEYPNLTVSFTNNLNHNELIYHINGKSTVHFNGKILDTKENTIRFLPKGENKEYIVEKQERGECIDVFFDTDFPISNEAFVIDLDENVNIGALFRKLFTVWVSRHDGCYFECKSLLYKIFAEIQKTNYLPKEQYNAIKPAIRYIEENFLYNKISVASLAKECGISETYLKKLFNKKFGVSPIKYIIRLKVNHASELLRSNRYSVTQVAEICGYDNIYFFSRQFKEYMGISPTDFINKYKSSK